MLDARNTSPEIGRSRPDIAVFGIGAIEQHSVHLPVGTDWLGISDDTRRVAEKLDAFLVPSLPFSMSQCHGPMAGTIWLKPQTLAAVVRDTVMSLYAQGFRRVLILNGHGGNFVLEAEIRELNQTYAGLIVLMPQFLLPRPGDPKIFDHPEGIHANEGETAHQMYINGEHVKEERVDFMPAVGREFLDYAFIGFICEWGAWGYPSFGTKEKGEMAAKLNAGRIAEWARETFARVEALKSVPDGAGLASGQGA